MAKRVFLALAISTLMLGLLGFAGCTPTAPTTSYPYPTGGVGPGGIMGPGGMMGSGGSTYGSGQQRMTMDRATQIAQNYLSSRSSPDIQASEIMEFQYNFYVQFAEKSTRIGAFEAVIDPYTGDMYAEPGPNTMWNTKYGTMSGMIWGVNTSGPMTISAEQATKDAQDFLNGYLPGATTDTPDRFYGYYTLHILKGGQIYGMLSVNGYTGQVWFHSWHGQFIGMKQL